MRPQRLCRWPLWGALLLLSSVAATQIIIDDTSSSVIYTGSGWQDDTSSYNAGGSAHQTDIPGNQAALNFTGNSIVMYGKTMYGGAEFSFSVDGNVKECSCYQSDASTTTYQVTLCQTTGLQSGTHQLLVTHVGQANTWLNVDQFIVTSQDGASPPSSTASSNSPTSPAGSSGSHGSSHTGAIIGAVVGCIGALALAIIFLLVRAMRRRRIARELPSSPASDPGSDSSLKGGDGPTPPGYTTSKGRGHRGTSSISRLPLLSKHGRWPSDATVTSLSSASSNSQVLDITTPEAAHFPAGISAFPPSVGSGSSGGVMGGTEMILSHAAVADRSGTAFPISVPPPQQPAPNVTLSTSISRSGSLHQPTPGTLPPPLKSPPPLSPSSSFEASGAAAAASAAAAAPVMVMVPSSPIVSSPAGTQTSPATATPTSAPYQSRPLSTIIENDASTIQSSPSPGPSSPVSVTAPSPGPSELSSGSGGGRPTSGTGSSYYTASVAAVTPLPPSGNDAITLPPRMVRFQSFALDDASDIMSDAASTVALSRSASMSSDVGPTPTQEVPSPQQQHTRSNSEESSASVGTSTPDSSLLAPGTAPAPVPVPELAPPRMPALNHSDSFTSTASGNTNPADIQQPRAIRAPVPRSIQARRPPLLRFHSAGSSSTSDFSVSGPDFSTTEAEEGVDDDDDIMSISSLGEQSDSHRTGVIPPPMGSISPPPPSYRSAAVTPALGMRRPQSVGLTDESEMEM